jgi:hypothetical protein
VAPATEEEYKQLANVDDIVGRLGAATGKSVSLIIEFKQVTLDPNKINTAQPKAPVRQPTIRQPDYNQLNQQFSRQQQMVDLQRQYLEIMRIQDPRQKQQRMQSWMQSMQRIQMQAMQEQMRRQQQLQVQQAQEMQREMQRQAQRLADNAAKGGPFKIESTGRSYEFVLRDDVIVRRMNLPFQYDDKGNVKQYTEKELAKLRGTNPKLPGFEAKIEELEPGSMVKLYIQPPKEGKIGGVDLVGNIIRPEVKMIVHYGDYDAKTGGNAAKK